MLVHLSVLIVYIKYMSKYKPPETGLFWFIYLSEASFDLLNISNLSDPIRDQLSF